MGKPTVVLTSAVAWHGVTARPQHLARYLAVFGWDVLFVESPITWLSPLKNKSLRAQLIPKTPSFEVPLPAGSGRLRVLSPVAQLPFGNVSRRLNRWNQKLLAAQIESHVEGSILLLSHLPNSADLVPHLRPIAVLYDCVDFHAEFSGFVNRQVVNELERDLAYLSRTVFATADALYTRMKMWNVNTALLPNAAEITHFATTDQVSVHENLLSIPEPRVGFIGGIGSWVNLQFIQEMAVLRPNVHFVMIGPVEANIEHTRKQPNVHFLGRQPYNELPKYLRGFAATLFAFKDNALTQSVNPVKIYEYIAANREVIATPTHELLKFEEFVWLTPSPQNGVDALDAILRGARKLDDARRDAFLANNSWESRAREVNKVLHALIPPSGISAGT